MKIRTAKLYLLVVFCFIKISLFSQVTIGSNIEPAKGALLDIKEKKATNGTATSTKGVIFPRVELANLTSLVPLLSPSDAANASEKTTHKGTVVYNVTVSATENLDEGLYYWDGEKRISVLSTTANDDNAWKLMGNAGTDPANNFIGTTDTKDFVIRTDNKHAATIDYSGNMGLGTNTPYARIHLVDSTRTATDDMLRVEGHSHTYHLKVDSLSRLNADLNKGGVYLENLPPTTSPSVKQVVADPEGKLYQVDAGDKNAAFNYLVYKIKNPGGGGDFVSWFNTKIPKDKYTLIVVGWNFSIKGIEEDLNTVGSYVTIVPAFLRGLSANTSTQALIEKIHAWGTSPGASVYATTENKGGDNNSWYLCADFIGGAPARGKENVSQTAKLEYEWTINCIAVNNAMVRSDFPVITYKMNEYNNVDAGAKTTGVADKNPLE